MAEYDAALEWARAALKFQPRDMALQRLESRLRLLRWCAAMLASLGLKRKKH
jgi:hypothetical protein